MNLSICYGNCIGGVWLACSPRVLDREFEPTVGSNQRLLVFVASPLSTQH